MGIPAIFTIHFLRFVITGNVDPDKDIQGELKGKVYILFSVFNRFFCL